MGLPVGNNKMNINAFQAHMARNMKASKNTKERLTTKVGEKKSSNRDTEKRRRKKRIKMN